MQLGGNCQSGKDCGVDINVAFILGVEGKPRIWYCGRSRTVEDPDLDCFKTANLHKATLPRTKPFKGTYSSPAFCSGPAANMAIWPMGRQLDQVVILAAGPEQISGQFN